MEGNITGIDVMASLPMMVDGASVASGVDATVDIVSGNSSRRNEVNGAAQTHDLGEDVRCLKRTRPGRSKGRGEK